jgi:hypothetical protein
VSEAVDSLLTEFIPALEHPNIFVRNAAAQSLYEMGKSASFATKELVKTLYRYPHEGAGMYSAKALGEIRDDSTYVTDALVAAASEPRYLASDAANQSHYFLTGQYVRRHE